MRIRTRPDKIKAGRIKMLKLIPNIITVIRLLLIPVFIFCFFACEDKRIAFSIFVLAELSDLLDGYLARRLNAVSNFGKLFDPLADKLLQVAALVCLTIIGFLPLAAAIIMAAKELVMVIGGWYVLTKMDRVVYSNMFGKIASFVMSLAIALCFFRQSWFASPGMSLALNIFIYFSVALSVLAMVQYGILNIIRPLKEKKRK